MRHEFQDDIEAIKSIDAVPTILDVVCRTTGMGFAAVARVTEDRWITCGVLDHIDFGLVAGSELKVETTICHEVRQNRDTVVINQVSEDEIYCEHPTPKMYGFQSYISMPITLRDGSFFGTLCAIDPKPARLKNPETIGMFKLFADLIGAHLSDKQKLDKVQADLAEALHLSELREQFIAVLGHDLRNPLGSIDSGTSLLMRGQLDDKEQKIVERMRGSSARMRALIDNVIDFARSRLGDGVSVERDEKAPLQPVLDQVIEELRSVEPEREIVTDFQLTQPIPCDHARVAQLLSNLVSNALTHGSKDTPVRVEGRTAGSMFDLRVSNGGTPIPPATLDGLFQPFFRGKVRPSQQGLGLGLYIASEIAKAHGGTLDVESTDAATTFTFRMPLGAIPGKE